MDRVEDRVEHLSARMEIRFDRLGEQMATFEASLRSQTRPFIVAVVGSVLPVAGLTLGSAVIG